VNGKVRNLKSLAERPCHADSLNLTVLLGHMLDSLLSGFGNGKVRDLKFVLAERPCYADSFT
jgi:hypothetical protein